METLSKLVIKIVEESFLNGFHISNPHIEGLLISHSLFANDNLIFCKLDESNLGYLVHLSAFEAMSRLRIHLSKSALIPVGEVSNVHVLARFFMCGVDYLPSSYLGLPFGAYFKSIAVWEPIYERFHKILEVGSLNFCLEGVD